MKTFVFEKISKELSNEELAFVKGGCVYIKKGEQLKGDTNAGDTYAGANTWQGGDKSDTRDVCFGMPTVDGGPAGSSSGGSAAGYGG
jgi:hypothetical protein